MKVSATFEPGQATIAGLTGQFDVILADPPWRFASNSTAKPGRNVSRHYPTMTVAEIAAMPVVAHAAKDAALFLWTTAPFLEAAFEVGRAWGFRYSTNAVWIKDRVGTGYWWRNQHEHLLYFRRGRLQRPENRAPWGPSVIEAPRREHSRKPNGLHDEIRKTWPAARRLELFSRNDRIGWTCWGNDVERFT